MNNRFHNDDYVSWVHDSLPAFIARQAERRRRVQTKPARRDWNPEIKRLRQRHD